MATMKKYHFTSNSSICLSLTLLWIVSLSFFFFFFFFITANKNPTSSSASSYHQLRIQTSNPNSIKVYVADLPRSYNYDLVNQYWASASPDSRLPFDPDHGGSSKTNDVEMIAMAARRTTWKSRRQRRTALILRYESSLQNKFVKLGYLLKGLIGNKKNN